MFSSIKRGSVVQSSHSLTRATMKRYREDEPFDSDDDFEQAMAREAEGFDCFSDEDSNWEHAMVRALDRREQLGGALSPLFTFRMEPIGRRRRWRDTVDHAQFHAHLEQAREARRGDNLGVQLMEALYTAIRGQIAADACPHDLLHFAIHAHGFTHAFRSTNIQVEDFRNRGRYLDELLDTLAGKLNSNEEFHPDRGLQIDVVLVRMPTPGSRPRKWNVGLRAFDVDSKQKRSIIRITNQDNLCCARAIVTMRAWCHRNDPGHMPKNNWDTLRLGRPRQGTFAKELHQAAGVPEGPCGLPELNKFQQYLAPTYQLKVLSRQHPFFLIFRGPDAPHTIVLLKSEHHYEGCTSLTGFTNRSYWCPECDRGFDHNDATHHPCEGTTCRACNRNQPHPCPDYDNFKKPSTPCNKCHLSFYGPNCLAFHRSSKTCGKFMKCLSCRAVYKVDRKHHHRCGWEECYSCGVDVPIATHRCHIQPPFEPPPPQQRNADGETTGDTIPPPKLMYADIECLLTEDRGFVPNLLCYRGEWQSEITTLRGEDCVDFFIGHLDDYAHPPDENIEVQPLIILFHNLKGFDGIFLLNSLYKARRRVTDQLTIGAKVLSFTSGELIFKDSLCFLPMPLSSFPSTFNLTELKKGFFPHSFNLPINQDYRGPIPALEYYDPDGMSPPMKEELKRWHAEQVRNNVVYDFQKELEEYCKSDVDILQGGCEKFCKKFESKAGFNPFADCATIASVCNRYWRKHHLNEDDPIAVEPPQGWRGARVNQSWAALQWLSYQESLLPNNSGVPRIKHVRNGGEQKVQTDRREEFVDGLDETTHPKTVYEFMGCLWHGCPTCCKHQRWRQYGANPDRTLEELYEATQAKLQRLQRAGYRVVVQWECDWQKQINSTPALQSFLSSLTSTPPLQPRDVFFGGRTGAVALHHDTTDTGEKIFYVDVTSLYPWVNKTARYPLGHPELKFEPEDQDLDSYFGIAVVTIRPPRKLYHPVLPVRHGNKLTFPLCMACVREEQPKPLFERSARCNHTDQQRQLRGTWCTPELQEARKRGYILVRIHEVWHFEKSKVGLFKDYVNTWLQIKQEFAGWPRWCETQQQKQEYLRRYKEKEGITLENVADPPNPGRKQVAKLMLNSFWGKFGERTNKSKVLQVKHPHELFNVLTDSANQVQSLRLCTDELMEVVYKQTPDNDLPSAKTNIFIACFTTCWARLKLYSYLDRLKEQVLYYDTDSVIYTWKEGQTKIEIGDFLGDMTDELDGDVIKEFVSGGAKNYGYKTVGDKYVCKVRGFTLNVRGREKLNYTTMKQHIVDTLEDEEQAEPISVINPNHFHRDQTAKKMKLVHQEKKYRLVFHKRVIDRDSKRSYPFGYF